MSTSSHNLGSLEVKPNGPQTLKIVSPVFVAKIEFLGKVLRVFIRKLECGHRSCIYVGIPYT